ncbi:Ubiquitin fusion degradation protein 4, partial [Linderina pennispora]
MPIETSDAGSDAKQLERLQAIEARPKVIKQLQLSLVPTMANIFLSTMNTAVRYRTLLVILKIVFFLNTDLLHATLKGVSVSTFVANIISSPEYPLLSGISLLLIRLLLAKLPDVYAQRFIREGVADELGELASFARTVMERAEPSESAAESSSDDDEQGNKGEGCDKDDDKVDLTCLAYGFKILNVHIPNSSRINPTGSARMFTLPAANSD